MIDILSKDNKNYSLHSVDELVNEKPDFAVIQFHDCTQADIEWLKRNFNLDFSIMSHYEDIEISSHFMEQDGQIAFHFSMPYYNREKKMVEEPVFFIIASGRLFFFTSAVLDEFLTEMYAGKLADMLKRIDGIDINTFLLEFISDYYADITEDIAKKIKVIAGKILVENEFSDTEMNFITQYSFNNMLVKEAVNEALRIFNLCRRSRFGKTETVKNVIDAEQNDLTVVSDYIQFNFERLRDLKDHINNKMDVQHNRIFQILTVATVCIALPTLLAGIYGMNFEVMPELQWRFGYPLAMFAIVLCALLPYLYFKKKKWLK